MNPALVRRWIRHLAFATASCAATFGPPCQSAFAASRDAGLTNAMAKDRYRQGVAKYGAGLYAEAVELFRQADRLEPSSALSYDVARAYEKLGDVPNALRFYRDYLRRDPEAHDFSQVERGVRALERKLAEKGLQQATLLSEPAGATVILDGEPVGVSPWTSELSPGMHSATFRMQGRKEVTRTFELPPDHAVDVTTMLPLELPVDTAPTVSVPEPEAPPARSPAAASPPAPFPSLAAGLPKDSSLAPEPPADRPPRPPDTIPNGDAHSSSGSAVKTVGFISLATGGAALAGAVTFEILRRNTEEKAKNEPEQIRFSNDVKTANTFQTDARVLAGVGAGLAALGGALVLFSPTSTPDRDRTAAVRLDVGFTGMSASLTGKF